MILLKKYPDKKKKILLKLRAFKMYQWTENFTDCKVNFVFHFLNPKDLKAAENHEQIKEDYGECLRNGRKMDET